MTDTTTRAARTRRPTRPSLRTERALHREGHVLVAGMDEVGRGALAGPVTVGVVVVAESTRSAPPGVKDSKLLAPPVRERLVPRVRAWAHAYGVGHAGPDEIDAYGILAALRLAGMRALSTCGLVPDIVVLDGKHDWLSPRVADPDVLFDVPARSEPTWPDVTVPVVRTQIKADMSCSSVAAASILAKVERDGIMVERAERYPQYGWAVNKGYAAPDHRAALLAHGPCDLHRRSWRLLGEEPFVTTGPDVPRALDMDDDVMRHDDPVKVRLT